MSEPISVVIICRNEAPLIAETIAAVQVFSNDVVVVDSGSTDGTQAIVKSLGARLIETNWDGYGPNKNKGVAAAAHDWILSIDADERVDAELANALTLFAPKHDQIVFEIKFRAYLGATMLKFGEWSNDRHIRLYHKGQVGWNNAAVHEQLLFPPRVELEKLPGWIHHYTAKDLSDFASKTLSYALLNGKKYFEQGKKASWFSCLASPLFSFLKNYFFRLGFLDGSAGLIVALMNAYYTWLKYTYLRELNLSQQA